MAQPLPLSAQLRPLPSHRGRPPPAKVTSGCGTRTWVHAPILSHLGTAWALLSPLPLSTSLPILAKAAVGHPAGRAGVVDLMNRGGLTGLNTMLVHHGGSGIATALRAIASATLPVALFCTAGKDRTGIVSAAVLAVCGATDAEIVADYAASEAVYVRGEGEEGGGVRAWYDGRLTQVGLAAAEWERAGPDVMVRTLEMMRQRSGTIEAYLEQSGMNCRWNGGRSVGRGGELVEHMEVGGGKVVRGRPALLCRCERGVGPLLRWLAGGDAEEREQGMKDGYVHVLWRSLPVGLLVPPMNLGYVPVFDVPMLLVSLLFVPVHVLRWWLVRALAWCSALLCSIGFTRPEQAALREKLRAPL